MIYLNEKLHNFTIHQEEDLHISRNGFTVTLKTDFSHVYGLGERFNQIDHKGKILNNEVIEKFCYQGEYTYFPLPFFFTDKNIGIYIKTNYKFKIRFNQTIEIVFDDIDIDDEIYVIKGNYSEIISDFIKLTGPTLIPPKWAFGPWVSAHRWNKQSMILEQLEIMKAYELPITVMVIEQWSDEATFYIFNGASYLPKNTPFNYEDFTFDDSPWPNPKQMVDTLHQTGIKVVLWQAPVIKALEEKDEPNKQHEIDQHEVVKLGLVAKEKDQSPYRIPEGHWFPGSYIPDFSNPKMKDWWFSRRKYLLDIGIDGFKTDGGEFVYKDDIIFYDGQNGKQMVNQYARDYVKAYHEFVTNNRVLFSRAGYIGQQALTIQWAGDQKSTWEELRNQYTAGLTASLSGQTFWSFDIGGFAGDLPEYELYIRATQFAVFTPIMQVHSEPIGGQFALLDASKVMNNERTPWNIINYYNRQEDKEYLSSLYWLRMNLLPHIYSESIKNVKANKTLMRHLMIDYPKDKKLHSIHEVYMFGNLMVVPNLKKGQTQLEIYFPEGIWRDVFTNEIYNGNVNYVVESNLKDIKVYVKEGCAIVLNTLDPQNIPSKVNNDMNYYNRLVVWMYGNEGTHEFIDDAYAFTIEWKDNKYKINGYAPDNIVTVFK